MTYVQDASDLSNIKEKFDRIESRHCLEHLPWRKVVPALTSWRAVLRKGGEIKIEVPSALHAARIVLGDVGRKLVGESDFEFFNRITFGHQDYPENFHGCLFTQETLRSVLCRAGFRNVTVTAAEPEEFILAGAVK